MVTNCARELDATVIKLEGQGNIRYLGIQLYWMCQIAQVSIPVVAEYLNTSDSTLYRHIQMEVTIKSDLYQRVESLIQLMARMHKDGVLPCVRDGEIVDLIGEQGLSEFDELVVPYLRHVEQPVIAAEFMDDYKSEYDIARKKIVKQLREADDRVSGTASSTGTSHPEDRQAAR